MGDSNLTSGNNEHTIVTVHSPSCSHEERAERRLARVTRRGTTSLEIEFPYPGVDYGDRLCLALFLIIPFMGVFVEIPTILMQTFLYGPLALWPLVFVPLYLSFIYFFLNCWKLAALSQTGFRFSKSHGFHLTLMIPRVGMLLKQSQRILNILVILFYEQKFAHFPSSMRYS